MENFSELSKEQMDALQEVGNIGIGNAASALADLLQSKIDITIPKLGIFPIQDAFDAIGGMEDSVIGVQLSLIGDAPGIILFLFNETSALSLTDRLIEVSLGMERSESEFDEMAQSAIQEIGNILTGTFTVALAQITNLNLQPSTPAFAYDMLGAILASSVVASEQVDDQVFVFETQFFQEDDEIKGHFLLLPSPGTLTKILTGLGL